MLLPLGWWPSVRYLFSSLFIRAGTPFSMMGVASMVRVSLMAAIGGIIGFGCCRLVCGAAFKITQVKTEKSASLFRHKHKKGILCTSRSLMKTSSQKKAPVPFQPINQGEGYDYCCMFTNN